MISLHLENFRHPGALARFYLTTILGVALDLWTKKIAFERLVEVQISPTEVRSVEPVQLIPGWIDFEVTMNRGAVFGLGQGQRSLFLLVSAGAIIFLTYLFANSHRQRFYQFVLGLLLAGVLGNMYDRYFFGAVRDMIRALHRWPDLFPYIFNVADIMLCTGVGLLILLSMLPAKNPDAAQIHASSHSPHRPSS